MPLKILLVDDHELFVEGLRMILERKTDYEIVGVANGGQTALEMAKTSGADIVLMDVAMPEINGIEATKMIKKVLPDIKILALSMNAEEFFVEQMIAAGANGYLVKDVVFEELVEAVNAVIDGKLYFSPTLDLSRPSFGDLTQKKTKKETKLSTKEMDILDKLASGKIPMDYLDTPIKEPIEEAHTPDFINANETADFSILKQIGLTSREIDVLTYLPLGLTNAQIALALSIQEVTVKKHLHSAGEKLEARGKTEILFQALKRKAQLVSEMKKNKNRPPSA